MYKRYLEPDATNEGKLPTKYIIKKLKRSLTVVGANSDFSRIHSDDAVHSDTGNTQRNNDLVATVDGKGRPESDNEGDSEKNSEVDEQDNSEETGLEDGSDNFFHSVTDELVHPNLECKLSDAVLMILTFFLEHQLTWVALEDLLQLFYYVLGESSSLPRTKYFFKKCFGVNNRGVFHFYCKNCELYLGTYDDVNKLTNADSDEKKRYNLKKCSNCDHIFSLNKMNDGNFFIQLPVKSQIEEKLKNSPDILNFDTTPNKNDCITDIFDGNLYKELKAKTAEYKLLTLTLNTDGVRVFKSKAKSSLWPIQMFINEVPLNKRFKQDNIILSAISFGKSPDFSVYLRPLIQELQEIDEDKIKADCNGENVKIALRVLLVSSDSPAKCKLLKLKQYNGQYGCTCCLHPGQTFGDSISKYPTTTEKYSRRTHSSTLALMKEFLTTGSESYGIIGVSPLLGFDDFDLIRGCVVDYMHGVLLGVVRLLADLWFDSDNHHEHFYITPRGTEKVNKNITCIQPPRFFPRQPRTIDDKQFWKANEFRSWLLFYAVPCLKGILNEKYFRHFSLLSEAIFIYLKTEISPADSQTASKNLNEFVRQFESYYGKHNMMYNVHLVEHLPDCVKDCGPLWGYSNFNFESSNGFIVKNVKGTSDVEHQLAEKYFLRNALSDRERQSASDIVRNYSDQIHNKRVKKFKKVGLVTLFGKPRKYVLSDHEKDILQETIKLSYNKLFYRNEVYYSSKFKRSKKRNDTAILLNDETYGEISLIFENGESVFLIVKKLHTDSVKDGPRHLRQICTERADEYFAIGVESISEKCILIKATNAVYISRFPNRFESD